MATLHNVSLLKAQCGIIGMTHTTHLDPPSSALRVSDALFMSLETQSQQTKITLISGSPKQLRKQSEKSSFGLLGHLWLYICITGLRVKCPRNLKIYVKMTDALEFIPCSRVNSDSRLPSACRSPPEPAVRLPAHLTSSRVPILIERASFAPEHSSKRSTESPDSQTLPRLFPRIPRLGKTFST
ncbi:hypothetical protein CRG98_012539 [Punica granatum]|uniref:Uncharacterized protein n=1 Tax=Punica granatum TaxID=22663 RepID=A0A2I0KEZ2_PUNGR|nr:hypothetical protein CRG98_012539 [Punica granatum]